MLSVTCPNCSKAGQIPEHFAGRRIKCGECGSRFEVTPFDPPDFDKLIDEPVPDLILDLVAENADKLTPPMDDVGALPDSLKTVEDHAPPFLPQDSRSVNEAPMNKKWEYKVLTQKDKWFSGKFDPAKLEEAMNAYAGQGWRVIAATTASIPGFVGGNRDELIVVLER
ncbi:DUF4177 domain-containing protein [Singulisphaera sp. Ch08]|uniref:DUF4177 domain-containing protein n=1 Tax=Singulisphaera sp. Ch08 TaxID=3120278 RepID=A0AAU7CLP0_9BACT